MSRSKVDYDTERAAGFPSTHERLTARALPETFRKSEKGRLKFLDSTHDFVCSTCAVGGDEGTGGLGVGADASPAFSFK